MSYVLNPFTGKLDAAGVTAESDPLSLHLDQTTPQSVINGQPNFKAGLISDPTGTFDITTVTGTPVKLGLYNPIPDDGLGGYNVATYFTSSDSQITTRVGGLAFGGTIIGADDGENYWGVADAYGINGFINVQGQSYTPYIQLAYLSSQVIGGSMVEAITGIYLSVLSSGVNSSIGDAVGIKVEFNTADSGSIGNCYGLKFEDITAGSVLNYAWYSGLGKVHFGDDVEMAGSLTGVTDLTLVGTTLGAEKLTNGTFTGSATGWSLGTGWAYNTNLVRKNAAGTGILTQALTSMVTPIIAGESYQLSFTISNKTIASQLNINCGGVQIANDFFNNGTYTYTFKAVTSTALTMVPSNNARFYIDTISIKRYAGSNNNFFAGDTYVENFISAGYTFQTQGVTEASPTTKLTLDAAGILWTTNKVVFTQTDGNEYIDSLADGYLDLVATTGIRFNNVAADTDVVTTWVGTTNSGVLTWMEDEDYFLFGDNVVVPDIAATTYHVGADAGIDATVPVAPVLPATVAGSMTFKKGILTAYTAPS